MTQPQPAIDIITDIIERGLTTPVPNPASIARQIGEALTSHGYTINDTITDTITPEAPRQQETGMCPSCGDTAPLTWGRLSTHGRGGDCSGSGKRPLGGQP